MTNEGLQARKRANTLGESKQGVVTLKEIPGNTGVPAAADIHHAIDR